MPQFATNAAKTLKIKPLKKFFLFVHSIYFSHKFHLNCFIFLLRK